MTDTTNTKPIFDVYSVDGEGKQAHWIPLGVAFEHENGKGANILLDALPINFSGKLVIRLREPKNSN